MQIKIYREFYHSIIYIANEGCHVRIECILNYHFIFLVPSQYDCNFEQNLCSWAQITNGQDNFDWTRFHGSTGTAGTGPTTDHTTGTCKF